MADTMTMALMAVIAGETNPTLLNIHSLLTNEEYRQELTTRLRKVILRRHWEKYDHSKKDNKIT